MNSESPISEGDFSHILKFIGSALMNTFRKLRYLFILIIIVGLNSPPENAKSENNIENRIAYSHGGVIISGWLDSDDYQRMFDLMLASGFYPRIVEARAFHNQTKFRGVFMRMPRGGFAFYSHHGISSQDFAAKDRNYRARGFTLVSRQSANALGNDFHQGVWVRASMSVAEVPAAALRVLRAEQPQSLTEVDDLPPLRTQEFSPRMREQQTAEPPPADPIEATAEQRVAIVIGNSAYHSVPTLSNPFRDVDLIAATLRESGFGKVVIKKDLDSNSFRRALRDFAEAARQSDWAIVYYAGHGIEVNGINYLVPIDASLKNDSDVIFETIPLNSVLDSVEGARKIRIAILDACRDNPFVNKMNRNTTYRSIGRGLSKVEPNIGNSIVMFAAKEGKLALDASAGQSNSPFVLALTKNMKTPRLEIGKFLRSVRDDVLKETNNMQEPFIYSSLGIEDFYFRR